MQLELGVLEFPATRIEHDLGGVAASGNVGEVAGSDAERSLHVPELDIEHLEFRHRVGELVDGDKEDEEGGNGDDVKH